MQPGLERQRKIWVVDDSTTDGERVRRLLVACDYDVEVIRDGSEALERLSSGNIPDLLLLDWMMPGISGIEVCQYMRKAGGKLAQLPILLLTARHGTQEIVQAFNSGANDYVSKPFVDEELRARVQALLETKKLNERAEQAEADVRVLLANAPDPIFAVDVQGLVSYVNEEGLRHLKCTLEEAVGKNFAELVPGIGVQNIGVGPGESFLPIPDVRIGDVVFSPSIRVLPSDNAAVTTVMLRDVTARRQAEERRLDFYSVIAHDLRTPVTSVMLRLQLGMRGKHGLLPAGHIADLRKCDASLRGLVGMINDFLELARLEGIGHKIDLKPVDLGQLVRTTMEDFAPLLEKAQLEWDMQGDTGQGEVFGDGRRITQVLSNLIGNAIKFTSAGGKISVGMRNTPSYTELAVSDTGRGISKEDIPGLFERFTRVSEIEGDTQGTGLGLMIVREIVEAHGGVIGVESQVGVGSRFWFRLPTRQETVATVH